MFHRRYLLVSCVLFLSACGETRPAESAPEAPLDTATAPAASVEAAAPAAAPEPVPLEGAEARRFERAGLTLLRTEQGYAVRSERSGLTTELPGLPVLSPDAAHLAIPAGGGIEIWRMQGEAPVREWSSGPTAPLSGTPRWEDDSTITLPLAAGGTLLVTNPGPGWMVMEPAG